MSTRSPGPAFTPPTSTTSAPSATRGHRRLGGRIGERRAPVVERVRCAVHDRHDQRAIAATGRPQKVDAGSWCPVSECACSGGQKPAVFWTMTVVRPNQRPWSRWIAARPLRTMPASSGRTSATSASCRPSPRRRNRRTNPRSRSSRPVRHVASGPRSRASSSSPPSCRRSPPCATHLLARERRDVRQFLDHPNEQRNRVGPADALRRAVLGRASAVDGVCPPCN